jgi:hypothetical protein
MNRFGPGSIAIAVAVLVLIVMYFSWRRRSRRDSNLDPIRDVPASLGAEIATATGFYVATTVHEKPFERLAVSGLGFRGRVDVSVAAIGIVIRIHGEPEIFIPTASIVKVAQATWAIDRVVEKNGLIQLSWSVDGAAAPTVVDSYFRIVEHDSYLALIEAIEQIAPAANATSSATGSDV